MSQEIGTHSTNLPTVSEASANDEDQNYKDNEEGQNTTI